MPEKYRKFYGWFDYEELYDKAVEDGKDGDIFVESRYVEGFK